MTKAKMNWENTQQRWRAKYKKVSIQVSARKLGGKTYEETVVAANRYYDKRVAEIDLEIAQNILRPNEAEYLSELDSMAQILEGLEAGGNDPVNSQALKIIKFKMEKIRKTLDSKTLPPLDISLKNPLTISAKHVERIAEEEAVDREYQDLLSQYELSKNDEDWLHYNGYYTYASYHKLSTEELWGTFVAEVEVSNTSRRHGPIPDINTKEIEREIIVAADEVQKRSAVRKVVDFMNCMEMRRKASEVSLDKAAIFEGKKKELGVIGDYERGQITQKLKEVGAIVPESKQLLYHVGQFIEFQVRRHERNRIGAGQLGLITFLINQYAQWVSDQGIKHVGQVCTKEHVDGYFDFIDARIRTENKKNRIKPSYARKLFNAFKSFVQYLINEQIIKDIPPWKTRSDDRYVIHDEPNEPEIIPFDVLRQILPLAPPRLQLFMLLALNCGFGGSEIGQLNKNEYNPVNARITHKRVKTAKHKTAPTVTYCLWNRTKELLDRQIKVQEGYAKFPENQHLLLLNNSGKPLWKDWFSKGKYHKNDNIKSQFNKFIKKLRDKGYELPDISFYMLRKTSASAIFNNNKFSHLDWLWLAHSPKSMAHKHYTAPSPTILDECLAWLEIALFDDPITAPKLDNFLDNFEEVE